MHSAPGTLRVNILQARKLRPKGLTGKLVPYAVFELDAGPEGVRTRSVAHKTASEFRWDESAHIHFRVPDCLAVPVARAQPCGQSFRSSASNRPTRQC